MCEGSGFMNATCSILSANHDSKPGNRDAASACPAVTAAPNRDALSRRHSRPQVERVGGESDSDGDSDGGSTSASEDEGGAGGQGAAGRPGRGMTNKAKAAALELLQSARAPLL